jgi:hypothetical protein
MGGNRVPSQTRVLGRSIGVPLARNPQKGSPTRPKSVDSHYRDCRHSTATDHRPLNDFSQKEPLKRSCQKYQASKRDRQGSTDADGKPHRRQRPDLDPQPVRERCHTPRCRCGERTFRHHNIRDRRAQDPLPTSSVPTHGGRSRPSKKVQPSTDPAGSANDLIGHSCAFSGRADLAAS